MRFRHACAMRREMICAAIFFIDTMRHYVMFFLSEPFSISSSLFLQDYAADDYFDKELFLHFSKPFSARTPFSSF